METLFVVAEPKNEFGKALVSPFEDESAARSEYNQNIEDGTASLEVGQHLVRLDNLTPELRTRLFNDTDEVVDSRFAGFDATYLESFAASVDQWVDGSLTVGNTDDDDDFDSSEDDYRVF